jgi:rubrerythrin
MAGFTCIDEILEFAIAREVEANKFYIALAARVENPAMGPLLLEFAKEELDHKATLELELIKQGRVVTESKMPAEFDIADYIVDAGDCSQMDYEGLLVLAMKKEKASFRLYVTLAAMAADQETQDVLISLAEEEARHKIMFEIEYDQTARKHE